MNTLTQLIQSIVPSFIQSIVVPNKKEQTISKEQFIKFHSAYKELAKNKQITATDSILYNAIRGLPLDRGFTLITNKIKLDNGQHNNWSCYHTYVYLIIELERAPQTIITRFKDTLNTSDLSIILNYIKEQPKIRIAVFDEK